MVEEDQVKNSFQQHDFQGAMKLLVEFVVLKHSQAHDYNALEAKEMRQKKLEPKVEEEN